MASPTSHPDILLRLALTLLAQDLTAVLTEAQRAWITQRLRTTTPFTDAERAKLRGPVLAWAQTRLHAGTVAKLTTSFEEER